VIKLQEAIGKVEADLEKARSTGDTKKVTELEENLASRRAFLEMAESAYRLGRGTLFELLDARRTQLEATLARIELLTAIVETELELRALAGSL